MPLSLSESSSLMGVPWVFLRGFTIYIALETTMSRLYSLVYYASLCCLDPKIHVLLSKMHSQPRITIWPLVGSLDEPCCCPGTDRDTAHSLSSLPGSGLQTSQVVYTFQDVDRSRLNS